MKTITLGELKARMFDTLRGLPDDTEITFGGGHLSFYRAKNRLYGPDNKTPKIVDIEFSELFEVTLDPDTD